MIFQCQLSTKSVDNVSNILGNPMARKDSSAKMELRQSVFKLLTPTQIVLIRNFLIQHVCPDEWFSLCGPWSLSFCH